LVAVPEADPLSGEAPLTVNFTGSNSLDDVGVTSYSWNFQDGSPVSTEADPTHVFTDPGDYNVSLTVGDADGNTNTNTVLITVTAPITEPPIVDAGEDLQITLPTNSVVLTGTASDPDGGEIVTFLWTQESGPGTATLSGADTATLSASDLEEGVYVFRLTATDDDDETGFDEVSVTVNAAATEPPIVDAGEDQELTLPTDNVQLEGTASDPDGGEITTYLWTQESGPSTATLSGADTATLLASGLEEGIYVFRLTATDEDGESGFDEVTITVNAASTEPPVVDAGQNQVITLPTNSVEITGSATDPDGGDIVSYLWTQESGPSTASLSGTDTPTLLAGDLAEGVYVFRLTATDDDNESNFDEVTVTVNAAGAAPPIVDAGEDIQLTLPNNSVQITGTATDPDGGDISIYLWTQESGPSTATLLGSDTATLTVSDLIEGVYVFRLTATDDQGEVGFDEVTVSVNSISTGPPIVNAGSDQDITLPVNIVDLVGSAIDPDGGEIIAYLWTQESGPSTAVLEGFDTAIMTASELVEGSYVFRLTATDDQDETGFDEVTISIQAGEVSEKLRGVVINPVRDGIAQIQIQNLPAGVIVTNILLHDYSGKLVGEFDPNENFVSENEYELNVNVISVGLYFVTIEFNEGDPIILKLMMTNP
jgi:PKD repeat protein